MNKFVLLLGAVACGGAWAAQVDVELSADGPVATPAAAVARARELRRSGAVKGRPVVIAVRPGRYAVTEPLVLGPEDSGLLFEGCGYGRSVFDGGVRLPPFRKAANGVWEADVASGTAVDQLWVNGVRAQLARSPNRFYHYMRDQDYDSPKTAFFADARELAPLAGLLADELAQVSVGIWQSWCMGYGRIKALDAQKGRIELAKPIGRPLFYWSKTCPRYTLENFRAALDAPGEWFHDRKARKLLYLPRDGEALETAVAVVPVASALVVLQGDRAKGAIVRDITFRGIGFEHTSFPIPADGLAAAQSAINVKAAVLCGDGADEVALENCRVAHAGAHGVWLKGCRHVRVRHCLIEDLGAGGVYLGSTKADHKNRERNAAFLEVSDSIVRHGGRRAESAIGVWIGHAHDCLIEHNDIYDFRYTGVSSGWTWGYAETVNRNIKVNFNRIHHIGQGVLSDMGGFYSLGDHTGSEVRHNWVWEVNGYADNGSPAWGLYTDEGSKGILFSDNLVEKCRDGAIHQHYGTENVHSNNIYVTFRRSGVWRSRNENHVTLRVLNNVFWWQDPTAETYRGGGGYESLKDMVVDGNLYWCASGEVSKTAFKGGDWEKWRQAGKDAHGAVADPLFVDSAAGDWRLRPESPALMMGFKPFDWRASGVRATDPEWVRKAAERTWDDFEDAPKAPRYRIVQASLDCEKHPVGPLQSAMGGLLPFSVTRGHPDGLAFTDQDVAGGKRALVFSDSPANTYRWAPHLNLRCLVDDGTAVIRFSFKPVKSDGMTFELRDYDVEGCDFVTGVVLGYYGKSLFANGKPLLAVAHGKWVDVELRVNLGAGRHQAWSVSAAVRDGEHKSRSFVEFCDKRFRHVSFAGFMSYGNDTGVWHLDDFKLTNER